VSGPLAGLRVLELASIGPGPHAAMMLADLGADVIRVERPDVRSVLARKVGMSSSEDDARSARTSSPPRDETPYSH